MPTFINATLEITQSESKKEKWNEDTSSAQTTTQPRRKFHERLSTPDGTLIETLASPEEVGDEICLIRGTVPPGVAVPLEVMPGNLKGAALENFVRDGVVSYWHQTCTAKMGVIPCRWWIVA